MANWVCVGGVRLPRTPNSPVFYIGSNMTSNEETIELDIPLILPDLEDERDECIEFLDSYLQDKRGVLRSHVEREQDPPALCVHYNPNLVTLQAVRRLALDAGSDLSGRYRHERIPFEGMANADEATSLTNSLNRLDGMLHASVNYAAGLVFVAYDTQTLSRARIERELRGLGITPLTAPVPDEAEAEAEHAGEHGAPGFLPSWVQRWWSLLLVALAGAFLLTGWAGPQFFGLPVEVGQLLLWLAYLAGGYDIATHALPGLLHGQFDTDVLMLAAAVGAAILGEWAEGAFLLFLFSLGHAGEHYALNRARRAVNALGELMPSEAHLKRGEDVIQVPVERLRPGDVVLVRPGDRIPADGEIQRGVSDIDQSAITGESVPVTRRPGQEVFAGTINLEASLDIKVSRRSRDNTLSRVMQMVADAQSQQSPTQQFTQRFTAWFVPAILILVVLVAAVPPLLGWMAFKDSFYRAMLLLVAASPCALALGTPAAVLAGIAQAARNGVLIKGGVHLENLGALKVMAFDKTGTLTEGRFSVTDIIPLNGYQPHELLALAAAVEQHSNHPLARAVVQTAEAEGLEQLPPAEDFENLAGLGARSRLAGQPVLIGSRRLFEQDDAPDLPAQASQIIAELEADGKSILGLSQGEQFLGVLALSDTPRAGVHQTLTRLKEQGVERLVMLTGDHQRVAEQIAARVGVTDVRAGLLPDQKLAAIEDLQREFGPVAMTGDGVNDAPALARATVGIAMGGAGTAVALETADVALMADDLSRLPFAVGLSRASRAIIRQNLAIALGIIVLLVLSSVVGLIQLSAAVFLHEGSTILVVLNALRLLNFKE